MKAQYRILELCLSNGQGGLELYVAKIVGQLRARGHIVYSITCANTHLSTTLQGQWNTSIRRPTPLALPLKASRIAGFIDKHQIDVLRINWGHDLQLACLAKLFAKRPAKLVYSRHMRVTRSKRDPLHRLLYNQVDLFTVVTRKLLREAEEFLPMDPANIGLLRLGISPVVVARDRNAFLTEQGLEPNAFTIGCFSRVERAKGQHVLIEALRIFKSLDIEVQALIVGYVMNQDYFNELQCKVDEYGLEGQVRFMGFVKEPMKIMPFYDVIVLPTYEETFGLVLVEAMHMGVAVIGTNAGGVPEIIDHNSNGLLFEPGNHRHLAGELIKLYKESEFRLKIAARGKKGVQEKYSDEHHIERLESLLNKLCATNSKEVRQGLV